MSSSSPASQFGPNEWLVEEMYDQFLADPSSVDAAWHDFFADFKPTQSAQAKADNARQSAEETPTTNGQATQPSAKAVQNAQSAAKQASAPSKPATPAKPAPKAAPKAQRPRTSRSRSSSAARRRPSPRTWTPP